MTDITRGAGHACQQEIDALKALNAELVAACKLALTAFEYLVPSEPYDEIECGSPRSIIQAALAKAGAA